jgi:hypothetical protein
VVGGLGAIAVGMLVRSRLLGASLVDPLAFAGATTLALVLEANRTLSREETGPEVIREPLTVTA